MMVSTGASAVVRVVVLGLLEKGRGAWARARKWSALVLALWLDGAGGVWWEKNPPYHGPVFVLTHYGRPPIQMEGGTVFHFVTGGISEALERATAEAEGKDVEIGGGVATLPQYIAARLIAVLHLAIAPSRRGS